MVQLKRRAGQGRAGQGGEMGEGKARQKKGLIGYGTVRYAHLPVEAPGGVLRGVSGAPCD